MGWGGDGMGWRWDGVEKGWGGKGMGWKWDGVGDGMWWRWAVVRLQHLHVESPLLIGRRVRSSLTDLVKQDLNREELGGLRQPVALPLLQEHVAIDRLGLVEEGVRVVLLRDDGGDGLEGRVRMECGMQIWPMHV